MKILLTVFALLLTIGLVPCRADTTPTQTWDVVAKCDPTADSFLPPQFEFCSVPAKISAVFTTQLRTGEFFDPEDTDFFFGTNAVVTNITGTFDGLAITFSPPGPTETLTGWLADGFPLGVGFGAGGISYGLTFLGGNTFLECFGPATACGSFAITPLSSVPIEPLDWSAVENVPEPLAFCMLLTALLLLGLSRWAQLSLRKLSKS